MRWFACPNMKLPWQPILKVCPLWQQYIAPAPFAWKLYVSVSTHQPFLCFLLFVLACAGSTCAMAGRALPACGFVVYADKAGALPLSIERRAKGLRWVVCFVLFFLSRLPCQRHTSVLPAPCQKGPSQAFGRPKVPLSGWQVTAGISFGDDPVGSLANSGSYSLSWERCYRSTWAMLERCEFDDCLSKWQKETHLSPSPKINDPLERTLRLTDRAHRMSFKGWLVRTWFFCRRIDLFQFFWVQHQDMTRC